MKYLIDTCVVIDVLQKREPFFDLSYQVLSRLSKNNADIFLTAKTLMDIHYLMRKFFHSEAEAHVQIAKLLEIFQIESTTESDCAEALHSEMSDFEDAVLAFAAHRIAADAIVTRNVKDYAHSPVPALTPEEVWGRLYTVFR